VNPATFNLRFRYPLTHLLTHGQTGSPNRPWQPGPISSGVTKNSEPLYTIYPYPRRALFPKPCSPQTSSSVPLATSTFDVAVHLAIGPTGPPDNCKVARRSSSPLGTTSDVSQPLGCCAVRSIPPAFTQPPEDQYVEYGDSANLSCVATGTPEPYVSWHRGDAQLTPEASVPVGTNVLSLTDVRESATYTCVAQSQLGRVEQDARVIVFGWSVGSLVGISAQLVGLGASIPPTTMTQSPSFLSLLFSAFYPSPF